MDEVSEQRRDRADPLIDTLLDKDYQVVRRIGVGGMSVVYVVEHTRLHKQFAAKVLHSDLALNLEAMQRFETEAKAASQLEHENIVVVTDFGVASNQRPYIIMELLKGQTLDERLSDLERPLTLQENVAVIVQVCRALACAHSDGIVHRDVKPDNIYLTGRTGIGVKVLDFGIAKVPLVTGRLTKHGQTIGSPHYMSPEACRGDEVDLRADIYSVGILMYQMFTGVLPHHDDNFLKLLQKHITDPVTSPSQINPEISEVLDAVIMHAIAKDPDDRYMSIDHLLREFELALPPGADELLRQSRVSTPFPGTLAARRDATPVPGTRRVHATKSSPLLQRTPRSRLVWLAPMLLLVVGGGIALWSVTRSAGSDEPRPMTAAAPPPPAALPSATTPATPSPVRNDVAPPAALPPPPRAPAVDVQPEPALTVAQPKPATVIKPTTKPVATTKPATTTNPAATAKPTTPVVIAKSPEQPKPEVTPVEAKPDVRPDPGPEVSTPKPAPPRSQPSSIDITATRASARSQIGPIQQCFERAKMDDPNLAGSITTRITVGPDGKVTGVQVTKSTLGSAAVEHCIIGGISHWQLPRPVGGGSASFSYPFVFD